MRRTDHPAGAVRRSRAGEILRAGALGLGVGLALHFVAVYQRDHGPAGAGQSLRGNGAAVVLVLAVVLLVAGAVVSTRRGGWRGSLLWSVALVVGLFVIAGGF